MLLVRHRKTVPHPFRVVLEQYYDYEHIAHVHPYTLGEYRLKLEDGDRLIYEQLWPKRLGRRRRSRVEQTFLPPNQIHFRFLSGAHRGVVVRTLLERRADGTLVDETYGIPWLPDWSLLRVIARPSVAKRIERIWTEDLDVEVCRGGWPGLPPSARCPETSGSQRLQEHGSERELEWHDAGDEAEVPASTGSTAIGHSVTVDGVPMALFRSRGDIRAIEGLCPHSGGPLALGNCTDGIVVCPWHGARFDLRSGNLIEGPTCRGVSTYETRLVEGRVQVAKAQQGSSLGES